MAEASPRGTYLVIAETLRGHIQDGLISEALPSEAALMREHSVSRNTVRRALRELEGDRLVESTPGVGWRVIGTTPRPPLLQRLTALIDGEALGVGDAFPSENMLCQRFSASRTAVRRALAHMEGVGLLITVHGRGRTVRALPAAPKQS